MSKEYIEEIKCPDCGTIGEFVVWESLNTMLNPEEKPKLMSGELFEYVCPKCGSKNCVDYGMLYHQMEDNFMIEYCQNAEKVEETIETIDKITRGGLGGLPAMSDDYKYRIVFSHNQLKEKIYIFDQGLDDRVIEVMKLFMMAHLSESNPELKIEEMLLDIIDDKPERFAIRLEDGKWGSTDFAIDMYESIRDDIISKFDDGKREYIVNLNWAIEAIQNINE